MSVSLKPHACQKRLSKYQAAVVVITLGFNHSIILPRIHLLYPLSLCSDLSKLAHVSKSIYEVPVPCHWFKFRAHKAQHVLASATNIGTISWVKIMFTY